VIANLTAVVSASVGLGFLAEQDIRRAASEALARLDVTHRRVLVLIPGGTRTMPMHLMLDILEHELGPRVAALEFLVALGTRMTRSFLKTLIARFQTKAGQHKIYNHAWNEPGAFVTLG